MDKGAELPLVNRFRLCTLLDSQEYLPIEEHDYVVIFWMLDFYKCSSHLERQAWTLSAKSIARSNARILFDLI